MQALRLLAALLCVLAAHAAAQTPTRPNIIWITIDDVGPDFACYGNPLVSTPTLDGLAQRGQRFDRAFVTTPVCSPVRSALITGCYATTIGAHQHRSDNPLPEGYAPITDLLTDAGYRCTKLPARRVGAMVFAERVGAGAPRPQHAILTTTGRLKTDFNFNRGRDAGMFEDWNPDGDKPFFAMIDFNPQKGPALWVEKVARTLGFPVDPADVTIHPYWPDTPEMRARVARYNEAVSFLDREIGEVLGWLEREGIADNTVVFVWGDHGQAAFRHKQWCYDSGLRVPLLVAGPGIDPAVRTQLVSSIDLAAATLRLAGVEHPAWMEGRDFLAPDVEPRSHIFASRDRCDETEDRVRAVRTDRYKLIRNYHPERAYIGRNDYTRGSFLEVRQLLAMRDAGELSPTQQLWCALTKPEWELYDLDTDPLELHNLDGNPSLAEETERLRALLDAWIADTEANNPYPERMNTIVPEKAHRQVAEQRAGTR